MFEKDRGLIILILKSIDKIIDFTGDLNDYEEFYEDEETYDATLMNFVVIGEISSKLKKEILLENQNINWKKNYHLQEFYSA